MTSSELSFFFRLQKLRPGIKILYGGEDISPFFYDELPVHTNAPPVPSERDKKEWQLVEKAIRKGAPILGICRGAQLLCCLTGGKLYQHIEGHEFGPHIIENGKEKITVSSYHHQGMIPKGKVLFWDKRKVRRFSEKEEDQGPIPEVVYFPDINALGVQYHPEWARTDSDEFKLTLKLVEEYLK